MSFFGDAGGFLFGGNADPGQYKKPELIGNQNQAIDDVLTKSQENPDEIQSQILSGVESSRGLLPTAESIGNEESALGMTSSESQRQALGARNQRVYDRELSSLKRGVPLDAAQMQMDRMQAAHKVLAARDKFNLDVAGAEIQSLLNERVARGAVIGDILGMGGAAAGYYLGSSGQNGSAMQGFKGAKIGASAGEGLGGATQNGAQNSSWYSGA